MPNTHIWRIITGDRAPCEQEQLKTKETTNMAYYEDYDDRENYDHDDCDCETCTADLHDAEHDDYPEAVPEQTSAPVDRVQSRFTPLFIATVVLFVLVCIVQTCLEVRCNREGHNIIYCTLTN